LLQDKEALHSFPQAAAALPGQPHYGKGGWVWDFPAKTVEIPSPDGSNSASQAKNGNIGWADCFLTQVSLITTENFILKYFFS